MRKNGKKQRKSGEKQRKIHQKQRKMHQKQRKSEQKSVENQIFPMIQHEKKGRFSLKKNDLFN